MRFLGSDFQINLDIGGGNGVLGSQQLPQVTTLNDGRFAVVYQSDLQGNSSDLDPIAAIYNADGSSSFDYLDVFGAGGDQSVPVVAALPGGGFGVVFTNERHFDNTVDANPRNITYVRAAGNASGTVSPGLAIGDFNSGTGTDDLSNPAIATLSDGRQVVVFEQVVGFAVNDNVWLNVVAANGLTTQFNAAAPLAVATNTSFQSNPAVAAIGNTALVVYEDATGTTISSRNIVARLFDGGSNTLGAAFTISDHTGSLVNPKIAALDDHRYVIVYTANSGDILGRIYDSAGPGLSAEFVVDQRGGGDLAPAVAATADGGFIVTWTENQSFDVGARRFNSDGQAMGQAFTVNTLTDGQQGLSTVAVSGVNALFGWTDLASRPGDPNPTSVRGQLMTLTTPPDFNNNGISDILWRNTSGALFSWDMNKSGVINSGLNVTFNGVQIKPDASFSIGAISDFNADGKADILWRSTSGFTALWTMNGSVIQSSSFLTSGGVAMNPDPSFSVAGVGDFDFDGNSDILWRSTNGALIMWTMDGPVIASSSFVTFQGNAVSPGAAFGVAGIGDFNGDGKSDILWRSTSGEIDLWQMDGSAISGSANVTAGGVAIRPDASFSIAGIGDFNADGDADILWRGADGSVIEWQMNGSTIVGSGVVISNGVAVSPDPSWHVVEIGDFNGDARTDMLWRNDNGALAEWLMNGTTIVASVTPSFNGAAVQPDATFSTQAKPTDFA